MRANASRDERWRRLEGVVDPAILRDKNVLVAGLGSGGSTVALELAKAGVGRFTLIDPDRIEESNLIRHECDDRYLGWNKAEAVADLILHRNPEAEVQAMPFDLLRMDGVVSLEVAGAALVAVCTDAEPPKHLLNRFCTAMEVPAVYAGVYDRATGGEVIRCPGGAEDACYACVTSVLKESVPVADGSQLDYGAIGPDGVLHAAPGLGLDVRLVALIQAKVCLATLLEPGPVNGWADLPGNVVLFGTAPIEGLFPRPLASAFLQVAAQDGCLMCGPLRTGRIAVPGA